MKADQLVRARAQHGYSLVEALVVLAIVALVSLVTVPNFIALRNSSKIRSGVRQFATDAREARTYAITKNHRVALTIGTSATDRGKYWFYYRDDDETWKEVPLVGKKNPHSLEPDTATANMQLSFAFPSSGGFTDAFQAAGETTAMARKDIIFFPNGTISPFPTDTTKAWVTISTDREISKTLYTMKFELNGSLKAQ